MSFQPKQQDSQKSDQDCSLSENVIKCGLTQGQPDAMKQ